MGPSHWPSRALGDLCHVVTKGTTPRQKTFPDDAGVSFVKVKDIDDSGWIEPSGLLQIDQATHEGALSRSVLEAGDVLFTIAGTIGRTALVPPDLLPANANQAVAILRPRARVLDRRFLYYLLRGRRFQHHATSRVVQSVQQNVSLGVLRSAEVPLPPLPEQRRIAAVLGGLDDRIGLNRKMNRTLEEMAQAIFRSQFIDFDGHDDLIDSELGPIPRGWRVEPLQRLAVVTMGASPKGDTYNQTGAGTPLINGPAQFGPFFPAKTKWTTAPTKVSEAGDLVLCVRGSTTGRRVVSDGEYCLGRGVCSIRSRTGDQEYARLAVHFALRRLLTRATGSVFPNLSGPSIKNLPILVPPAEALSAFRRSAEPMRERQWSNATARRTLTELRDTLLPKLISGELPVPEAEDLPDDALRSPPPTTSELGAP